MEERVRRYVADVLMDGDSGRVTAVTRFGDGDRHAVYRVSYAALATVAGDVVVRVSLSNDAGEQEQAVREATVLQRLDGRGAPRLYDFDGTGAWFDAPAMCLEFISGEHRELDAADSTDLEALGSVVASVHAVNINELAGWLEGPRTVGACLDEWVALIGAYWPRLREPFPPAVGERVDVARAIVMDALERARGSDSFSGNDPVVLLHGDVTAGNVLWSPRPVLIDWEYARAGDPADEIGYIFGQNALSGPQREAFWAGYRTACSDQRLEQVAARVHWWEPVTLFASGLWWLERWSRRADADEMATPDAVVPKEQRHYISEALYRLDRFDAAVAELPK